MKLKPLPLPTENHPKPDYETIFHLLNDYRIFVGRKAAFHIEYPWWGGNFSNKEEEISFFLAPEWDAPESYEELARERERLLTEGSEYYIRMIDAERERKLLGWLTLVLLLPYLFIAYQFVGS